MNDYYPGALALFNPWRRAMFSPAGLRLFQALYDRPHAKHHNKRQTKPTNRKPGKQQARQRRGRKR